MPVHPIILSGPSGGGKSTLIKKAMNQFPGIFAFSVSHTTRSPRVGEEHGVHYFFTDRAEMERMIKANEFMEYVEFGGNIYGTSFKQVNEITSSGKICVLDLELRGVRSLKAKNVKAKYIMVKAPLPILEQRLRRRGTETEDSLQKRLKHAEEDMLAVQSEPDLFDYIIDNVSVEAAYTEFANIIAEDIAAAQNASD